MGAWVLPALILTLSCGCTQKYGYTTPQDSGEADADTDTDTDTDTDEPPSDDVDGDGFTPAEGDCDDGDIWVSPNREEDPEDGKDNDCDGRTDEIWSGVTVSWYNAVDPTDASLVTLDAMGRKSGEVHIDGESVPTWLDHSVDGGWVINNGFVQVTRVTETGEQVTLADFTEDDYGGGVAGVATHPDGYYVATTFDDLWRIDPDGTVSLLASWSADFEDASTFDLYGYTLAVDPASGDVGVFCQFGGFGVWSAATGEFTIHRRPDIESFDGLYTYSGAFRDGGGWMSLTYDGSTGTIGVSRFRLSDGSWEIGASWTAGDLFPNVLTVNGDEGDFLVTANGGWHYMVWAMDADGSDLTDFYDTYDESPDAQNRGFWGIVSNY